MKNIAIVTGPVHACGIHAYAMCVYEILKNSKKYNFYLFELSTPEQLLMLVEKYNIHSVVYNWHPATTPWCTPQFTNQISNFNQFLITGHELHDQTVQFSNIKAFINIDPTLPETNISYPGVRPITYYPEIDYSPPEKILKIGTSGFGHFAKGFGRIVNLLNEQFKEENVELNVHFSFGHFVDPNGGAARNALADSSKLNPNIKLNVTHQFFEKVELVSWLNNNDINIYTYDYYHGPGVSASIDKAIAAKKPIGVNDSNYFKHIRKDIIDVNKTSIKEIVSQGIAPLQEYYNKWNPKTFIEQYEFILDKYGN